MVPKHSYGTKLRDHIGADCFYAGTITTGKNHSVISVAIIRSMYLIVPSSILAFSVSLSSDIPSDCMYNLTSWFTQRIHKNRFTCHRPPPQDRGSYRKAGSSLRSQFQRNTRYKWMARKMAFSENSERHYIDAGANLLDPMYQGTYNGKHRHEPDLDLVLQRSYNSGVRTIVSLAGTVKESLELLNMIEGLRCGIQNPNAVRVFSTVGIHPTRCAEEFAEKTLHEGNGKMIWSLKPDQQRNDIIQNLITIAKHGMHTGNIVAIGECGLDYARLEFCPKDIQQIGLRAQLKVSFETGLPLYLHNRESGDDLYAILSEYKNSLSGSELKCFKGIVHSFDETIEIAHNFISLGLFIGINGCSLKTIQNLATVKMIPLENIILETDCPWCDIRPTHAGYSYIQSIFPSKKDKQYDLEVDKTFCVKNRSEPCHVVQVAEVVAGVKGLEVDEVLDSCYKNALNLFGQLQ